MRDAAAPLDRSALASLPIFPLPNCVLLPGGLLPLHVFEPRYRLMTRRVLDADHEFGVVLIERGSEVGGDDVRTSIGTVARIIEAAELDDGRFVLLLRGVGRAELARELPITRQYRLVEARELTDMPADPAEAVDHQRRLISLCDRLAEVIEQGGPQLRDLVRAFDNPGACADAVAAALVMDADARQELLEACCPLMRLQRTLGYVSHLLCELAPCEGAVN
jgi:Lon protease-like protein